MPQSAAQIKPGILAATRKHLQQLGPRSLQARCTFDAGTDHVLVVIDQIKENETSIRPAQPNDFAGLFSGIWITRAKPTKGAIVPIVDLLATKVEVIVEDEIVDLNLDEGPIFLTENGGWDLEPPENMPEIIVGKIFNGNIAWLHPVGCALMSLCLKDYQKVEKPQKKSRSAK